MNSDTSSAGPADHRAIDHCTIDLAGCSRHAAWLPATVAALFCLYSSTKCWRRFARRIIDWAISRAAGCLSD